jgi:hypothetical protein
MRERRFPPPWFIEDVGGSFVVKASNDRPPIFIYYRDGIGRRSLTKLLTRNAARRIAIGRAPYTTIRIWTCDRRKVEDGNGWSENAVFLTEFQRIAEGLRKAGLPE